MTRMKKNNYPKLLEGWFFAILLLWAIRAPAQYFEAVTNLRPVGYWPMNETAEPVAPYIVTNLGVMGPSGNAMYYTWLQGSNGNGYYYTNTIIHVPGATGDRDQAMTCGESGQWLILPRLTNGIPGPLILNSPFTIEMWLFTTKHPSRLQGIVSEGHGDIDIDGNSKSAGAGFLLGRSRGNYVFILYGLSGPRGQTDLRVAVDTNQWQHIVVTFDGTNGILYSNGIEAQRGTFSAPSRRGRSYIPDPQTPFLVGCGPDPNIGRFSGNIDDVAIYDSVLSPVTIKGHSAAASKGQYSQAVIGDRPLVYYRLDEPAWAVTNGTPLGTSITGLGALPIATNYGSFSLAGNGVYLPGSQPGVAGPSYSGFGAKSRAVSLNGIIGAIRIEAASVATSWHNLTGHQAITATTWLKANPADGASRFQGVMGHGDHSWRLSFGRVLQWNPGAGRDTKPPANGPIINFNDGKWHMLTGVWDGTNVNSLYLDAVLLATGVSTNEVAGGGLDIIFGGAPDYTAPPGRFWNGSLAHAALFTNALTGSQIQSLYSAAHVPPRIVVQPSSGRIINPATSVRIKLAFSGSDPMGFQWYHGNNVNTCRPIPWQTNACLAIASVQRDDAGLYFAVATNTWGSVTSSIIPLAVQGEPIILDQNPAPGTITRFSGVDITFTVRAIGAPPMHYQWMLNGETPVNGATNTAFTITNLNARMAGNGYSVVVTNTFGRVSSAMVTIEAVKQHSRATNYGKAAIHLFCFCAGLAVWPVFRIVDGRRNERDQRLRLIFLVTLGGLAAYALLIFTTHQGDNWSWSSLSWLSGVSFCVSLVVWINTPSNPKSHTVFIKASKTLSGPTEARAEHPASQEPT